LSGRHEPSSSASFWFSLSTTVLRAALVVAGIVVGVFVLSKAFPTGSAEPSPVGEGGETEASPTETPDGGGGGGDGGNGGGGGGQPQAQESPQVQGVQVSVLNGTGIDGLAACTADRRLGPLDYQVAEADIGDASREYDVTTISYARDFEADAEYIRDELFPDAELQRVGGGAITDVSIALGPEAATGECESP
jgi:LytR cell envelope-related transcriptional attenuator